MGNTFKKTCDDGSVTDSKNAKSIDECAKEEDNREDYHNNVDILFVLDTTSSMSSYIMPVIKTIEKIVESFAKMEYNIKFSICTYRDHPPQESTYVYQFQNLITDKQMVEYLKTVQCYGGGDGPEAVMDGLREGLSQTSWRVGDDNITPSKRFLFHICDAPPHGNEYSNDSSDPKWKKNGCPCGTTKNDIYNLLKTHNVHYHLIKAIDYVDKMEKVFKKCFGKHFAETIKLDPLPQTQVNAYPSTDLYDYSRCEALPPSAFSNVITECVDAKEPLNECEQLQANDNVINSFSKKEAFSETKNTESLRRCGSSKRKVAECSNEMSNNHYKMQMEALENCSSKNNMWDGVVNAIHKKL